VANKSALELATEASRGFEVLKCFECAANIKKALLGAGHKGQWVEIRGASPRPNMVCLSFDGGRATITQNGRHVGIRVGDMMFDNLHPDGLTFDEWLDDFAAIFGVKIAATTDF
jgi:Papain fold toxin 2